MYLTDCCRCVIVRKDKSGYWVIRNLENEKICGVPKNDPLKVFSVHFICKQLEIAPPDAVTDTKGLFDKLSDQIGEDLTE